MQDIKEYIQVRATECEKRSENWEEKIQICTGKIKSVKNDEDMQTYKLERQQYIGKKNELLAVADFCNELLQKYFS